DLHRARGRRRLRRRPSRPGGAAGVTGGPGGPPGRQPLPLALFTTRRTSTVAEIVGRPVAVAVKVTRAVRSPGLPVSTGPAPRRPVHASPSAGVMPAERRPTASDPEV